MTMPHLENCRHSEAGWCLECVKAMGEENAALRVALLEVSRITLEARCDGGDLENPSSICVKPSDFEQYHKASKLVGEACRKYLI